MSERSKAEAEGLVDMAKRILASAEATLGGVGMSCFWTTGEHERAMKQARGKRDLAAVIVTKAEELRDEFGDFS